MGRIYSTQSRQGIGFASAIETSSCRRCPTITIEVARGLASRLRLKPITADIYVRAYKRRQGIGFASAIETAREEANRTEAKQSPGDWLRVCD